MPETLPMLSLYDFTSEEIQKSKKSTFSTNESVEVNTMSRLQIIAIY
jgi:hypothetical protein